MSSAATAWLLDIGGGVYVALGQYLMREVISTHEKDLYPTRPVAMSNNYCHDVMLWRGLLLPIMQLGARMGYSNNKNKNNSLLVVAIAPANDTGLDVIAYGVLQIWGMPEVIEVWDAQPCEYPHPDWQNIASSCFSYNEQSVPILDTAKIFLSSNASNIL